MSKSYDNTIALFAPREAMRRQIAGIVTDSRAPGEPKEAEGSALFQIYQAFATPDETAALRRAFADGIGWGDAKQLLFERIDGEIAPMRETYAALLAEPEKIETVLLAGAEKAQALARPFMAELRHAVGLRSLGGAGRTSGATTDSTGPAATVGRPTGLAAFKQYREADGRFYFKLVEPRGRVLLQSLGFAAPKEAGAAIAKLQREGDAALPGLMARLQPLSDTERIDVQSALQAIRTAREAG